MNFKIPVISNLAISDTFWKVASFTGPVFSTAHVTFELPGEAHSHILGGSKVTYAVKKMEWVRAWVRG